MTVPNSKEQAMTTLTIEEYDFGPDTNERLATQIDKIRDAGIAGQLKDIAWNDGTLDAVLVHEGFELSIKLNATTAAAGRLGEGHLDPNHQGETACEVRACFGGTSAHTVAGMVTSVTRYSRVFDAWARGAVSSTDEVKFGIPFTSEDADGSVITSMIVETQGGSFEVVLAGDVLHVHGDEAELGGDVAAAFLQGVAEATGTAPEDLVSSLKACQTAGLPA